MTFRGARRLMTMLAVIASFPAGASAALADDEPAAPPDQATQRHERAVNAWLAEQRHAARPR